MPGCQRCHVRLNAPVQGLEDNIQRHMMLFLCGTLRDFNLSHSKRRCQGSGTKCGMANGLSTAVFCHHTLESVPPKLFLIPWDETFAMKLPLQTGHKAWEPRRGCLTLGSASKSSLQGPTGSVWARRRHLQKEVVFR